MFLDIAVGIVLALLTGAVFDFDVTRGWILLGIAFALLPDIDVIFELIKRKGKLGGKELGGHREWTHYPLLYPIWTAMTYWFFGGPTAFLLGTALFWHILHDSNGAGWGIVLFGPFSKKHYKIFANPDGSFSWWGWTSWEKEELRDVVRRHGNPDWIRDIYLRPTWTSISEIAALIAAILFLIWYL
jgi:hypothetical protein